jgi:hypothetical protein
MNVRDDDFELTGEDHESLAKIEELLAARKNPERLATVPVAEVCTQLAVTVPRADDHFRQQLEARLVAQYEHQKEASLMQDTVQARPRPKIFTWLFPSHPRLRRAFASLSLMVFLMAGLIVTVPPVRTWAQDALDSTLKSLGFVRMSQIPVLTAQPNDPNSPVKFTQTTPVSLPPIKYPGVLSLEQAQAQAGFPLKVPGYLPAGYTAKGFTVGPFIIIGADGTASNPPSTASWEAANGDIRMTLLQSKGTPSLGIILQNEPTTEVMIGDVKGVYVQGHKTATPNSQHQFVEGAENILAWEKDGILYRLLAYPEVSLSEMLKVAESLK